MAIAGIRDLKTNLSSYIDVVRQGERVIVTEHGEEVAIMIPLSREHCAIRALAKAGKVRWSGGRPKGLHGIVMRGKSLAETVLEERS